MSQYQPMYNSFQRDPRDRYVPTSRISVAASVYLPASDLDLQTGQLKPDHQRRRRTQAQRLEREELEKKEQKLKETLQRDMKKGGVRISIWTAAFIVCAVLVMGGLSVGLQRSRLTGYQDQINKLQIAIEACQESMSDLEIAIAKASDEATICYAASQTLNMIPAESAKAVHLSAVDTRPLQTAAQPAQNAQEIAAAATQIPMLASAGN